MTMPQYFRSQGYTTVSFGKVFDGRSFASNGEAFGNWRNSDKCAEGAASDSWCSWDRMISLKRDLAEAPFCRGLCSYPNDDGTCILKAVPVKERPLWYAGGQDEDFHDHCLASHAINELKTLAKESSSSGSGKKFFLAVGFAKPHMPWPAPKDYFEQWRNGSAFKDMTTSASTTFWETESHPFTRSRNKEFRSWKWTKKNYNAEAFRRAYYATVSFIDVQIGRVVDALKASPAWRDTVILLWGDHGFHLGEYGLWGKKTLLEASSRVPFVVVPPKNFLRENPEIQIGTKVSTPTDSVDILPTVLDVAGVWPEGKSLQDLIPFAAGVNLRPLLSDPKGYVRAFAVSQYQSHYNKGNRGRAANWYGYSLRSKHYRFIVYAKRDVFGAFTDDPLLAKMQLFYLGKPGELETLNVFDSPEHAHAREAFLEFWANYHGRDWVGTIGVKPFDHDEVVSVASIPLQPPAYRHVSPRPRTAIARKSEKNLCQAKSFCRWNSGECLPVDGSVPFEYCLKCKEINGSQ